MTCSIFYTRLLALREKIIQPGKRYAGKRSASLNVTAHA